MGPGGQQHQRKQYLPRHGKAGSGDGRRRRDRNQWCSFHESTTHRDANCRTQHGVGNANAGNANYSADYIDHPISFTAVEAPTEEEAFWPFGPTDEPVDTSGLFGSFGGVREEEADDSLFMVEEEPTQRLGFREHIVGGLTTMTRALVMVTILHYLWLSFGNSIYTRMVKNTYEHPEVFDGISSAEAGRLSRSAPPRGRGQAAATTL